MKLDDISRNSSEMAQEQEVLAPLLNENTTDDQATKKNGETSMNASRDTAVPKMDDQVTLDQMKPEERVSPLRSDSLTSRESIKHSDQALKSPKDASKSEAKVDDRLIDDLEVQPETGDDAPLVDGFDQNFVDRRAEPTEDGTGELCDVCYLQYKEEDFFNLKCGHSFCVNCQADHLKTRISNGLAMKLLCMQTGCKETYSVEQIQQFCSAKIQRQYDVIKEDVRVGKSRSLKWCARPGCDNTVRRPCCCCKRKAICACGFATCFKCGDPWHEASCKVSGETGRLMHNINPRVSKCPNCRAPIYKVDGCNHMTCYRCNKEYCWICRQNTPDGYDHFEPGNLFGCSGMTFIPQSVLLWILALLCQVVASPVLIQFKLAYSLGKSISSNICCLRNEYDNTIPIAFWAGVFLTPVVSVGMALVLPVVVVWRLWLIFKIVVRHFICCCFC